ncbi:MAG: hypothetical protein KTV77_05200 [Wolbachia endosymbiont of Fragariocoptes setiger]|nr:hypothetical protein [Wolbachia endosymbiont of Fragariocoptes setiger]
MNKKIRILKKILSNTKEFKPVPQSPTINKDTDLEEHIFYCLKATYDQNRIYSKLNYEEQQKLRKEWIRIYNESSDEINGSKVIDLKEKAQYAQALENIVIETKLSTFMKDNKVYSSQDSGIASDISTSSSISVKGLSKRLEKTSGCEDESVSNIVPQQATPSANNLKKSYSILKSKVLLETSNEKDNVNKKKVKQNHRTAARKKRLAPQPPIGDTHKNIDYDHIFYCSKTTYDKNLMFNKLNFEQQQKLREEWIRIYNESPDEVNGSKVIDVGEKDSKYQQVLNNIVIYDSIKHEELQGEWSKIYNASLFKAMKLRVMDLTDKIKLSQSTVESVEEALVEYLKSKICIENCNNTQSNTLENQSKQVVKTITSELINKLSKFQDMLEIKKLHYKQSFSQQNKGNICGSDTFSGYNRVYDLLDLEERRNFKSEFSKIYNSSLCKLKNLRVADLIDTPEPNECEQNLKKALTEYMNNKLYHTLSELYLKDECVKKSNTKIPSKEIKKEVIFITPESDSKDRIKVKISDIPIKHTNLISPTTLRIDNSTSSPTLDVKDLSKRLEEKVGFKDLKNEEVSKMTHKIDIQNAHSISPTALKTDNISLSPTLGVKDLVKKIEGKIGCGGLKNKEVSKMASSELSQITIKHRARGI